MLRLLEVFEEVAGVGFDRRCIDLRQRETIRLEQVRKLLCKLGAHLEIRCLILNDRLIIRCYLISNVARGTDPQSEDEK